MVPFPRVVIHYCEINAQVTNEVATLTAQTRLIIEKTTPHAPSNVTVTRSIFDSRQKFRRVRFSSLVFRQERDVCGDHRVVAGVQRVQPLRADL